VPGVRSAFFGIFDPDGRPWDGGPGKLAVFQRGLESALKIAFLTQRQLIIPAGYFFDNPALQRIVDKYGESDDEAKAFRALCADLLRISLNETIHDAPPSSIDWPATWDAWVRGSSSNRGQMVYLNSLSADAAEQIQAQTEIGEFKRLMVAALMEQQGIDFDTHLDRLKKLRLAAVRQPPFQFDKIFRERFLTRKESFRDFREPLFDKLLAAAEATAAADVRLSRSLLSNRSQSLEIGIPEALVIERPEYRKIVRVLAHYHHLAFASALGLDAFTTYQIPTPAQSSSQLLRESFASLTNSSSREDKAWRLAWPLGNVTFTNIAHARLGRGRTKFFDSLNSVYDLAAGTDAEEYNRALRAHARVVAGIVSFDFGAAPPERIAADVAGAAFTAAATPEAAGSSARKLLPYFKDFAVNIRKEMQLRFFFRSLEEEVPA